MSNSECFGKTLINILISVHASIASKKKRSSKGKENSSLPEFYMSIEDKHLKNPLIDDDLQMLLSGLYLAQIPRSS
jgi:hypothetical protein